MEFDTVKILLTGPHRTGKSWLLASLAGNTLPSHNDYRPTLESCIVTEHPTECGKRVTLKLTELGPDNDLLYNLYVQMSDVVVIALDSNNAGSLSEVSSKIRDQICGTGENSSPVIIAWTRSATANCKVPIELTGVCPCVRVNAETGLGMKELKDEIIRISRGKTSAKNKQMTSGKNKNMKSNLMKVKNRLRKKSIIRRNSHDRKTSLLRHLEKVSDAEFTFTMNYHTQYSDQTQKQISKRGSTMGAVGRKKLSTGNSFDKIIPKEEMDNETKLIPELLPGGRQFRHLTHIVEVPPIVSPAEPQTGIISYLQAGVERVKGKVNKIHTAVTDIFS